jgi:uridine phosphorylase
MKQIPESELILNKDGSIYHLNLLPEDLASTIINVGDPDRVAKVSRFFEKIEVKKQKREFVTHTGYYNSCRITVLSTGIGTDNIDIVYNELDALVNIDLKTRFIKETHTPLNLVRIGTSGALQPDIPVESFVCSRFGLGLDGLLNFYHLENNQDEDGIIHDFRIHFPNRGRYAESYLTGADSGLFELLSTGMHTGITVSCSGFYGPQGRQLRLKPSREDMLDQLSSFQHKDYKITNFEMETGAMYGLARLLGHKCCSVNVIVANRMIRQYAKNADAAMDKLIETVLNRLTQKKTAS